MKKKIFLLIMAFLFSIIESHAIPQPCTPPNDPCQVDWSELKQLNYNIEDCLVFVFYVTRICPSEPEDLLQIQILTIETYGEQCENFPDSFLMQASFQEVADYMNITQGWPPLYMYDCCDYWEFIIASCWITLYYHNSPPAPYVGLRKVLVPCDGEGCCVQQIQACKKNEGVSLRPIGDPVGYYSCEYSKFPDISQYPTPDAVGDCLPRCDDLKFEGLKPLRKASDINENKTEQDMNVNIVVSKDIQSLVLNIEANSDMSLSANFSDLVGNELAAYNVEVKKGIITYQIDISKYATGAYFISIYHAGKLLKTEKILINR